MSKEKLERLAAFGAYGVCVVLLAIWVLLIVITLPRPGAVGGGIDMTQAVVTWVSVGLVVITLIVVHVLFARKLLAMARGERFAL